MKIYLVGGAVRDRLLGLPVKDRDWVVVGSTPSAIKAQGFRPVGKDFPVFIHPKTGEEYALARTERKSGHGYTGFTFHTSPDVTLEEDLLRRDLTINAMAETDNGELIDPYHGHEDLQNRILRHVSPAFREDPLRILRTARFAARYATFGFQIADETMALMKLMVSSGEVNYLVAERVWQEAVRALAEPSPVVFFDVLNACGALSALMPILLPGFSNDSAIPRTVLARAAEEQADTVSRFVCAALPWEDQAPAINAADQLKTFCADLKVPVEYREMAILVANHLPTWLAMKDASPESLLTLLEKTDVFRRETRFQQFLSICELLTNTVNANHQQRNWLETAALACKSVDIQALVKKGHKGQALAAAIRKERLSAIAAALAS
ncbi:MAG: multifunctional CCA tRNA nucleotidyl transferase/2'3'-cyclic phosphodiesterase/2'nucleotidase/phosphatase [Oceanospirillales bacterium LUC14_002_19_P2]|nr:MAG: multifunctional CCA tRNA nucleotidyl transferase/2'3'-cyclic phosphodiesterase/2'nucleotidase/phosphatase [Oceanospirillales bacterium LUC14_002_19_P2]